MGTITKIEEQKNKNRVNIFIDDSFFCGLEKETAIIFGLRENKEVSTETLENALKESEIKRAFEKSLALVSVRMHSEAELTQKLRGKGFENYAISGAISKLKEYSLIDDEIFAKTFISQSSRYSKKQLRLKLMQKGIASDIIEKCLSQYDDEDELALCEKFAKKYVLTHKISTLQDKQKLFSSLLRRGFSYETVRKSTEKIKMSAEEDF